MLYGRPIKHIRRMNEKTWVIEPQRFQIHPFWKANNAAVTPTDGLDLENDVNMKHGSIVTKHKMDILITPETIEPQQVYMGRIKLSFNDILAEPICGVEFDMSAYQSTVTEANLTTPITPQFYPDTAQGGRIDGIAGNNKEIGGSGSGKTITDWLLDDNIKHYINLKKITVFDQRPLMGERWQRIPAKVKRINPYTLYALMIFNDSKRGATPADTQITVNIKDYLEELAI